MNWQDQIDKHHKGQTGFFKEIENMATLKFKDQPRSVLLFRNQGRTIEALETIYGIKKGKRYEVVSEQYNYSADLGYDHVVTIITDQGAEYTFRASYFKGLFIG